MQRKTAAQLASEAFWNRLNTVDVNKELLQAKTQPQEIVSADVAEAARSLEQISRAHVREIVTYDNETYSVNGVLYRGEFYTVEIPRTSFTGSIGDDPYLSRIDINEDSQFIVPDLPLLYATMERICAAENNDSLIAESAGDYISDKAWNSELVTNTLMFTGNFTHGMHHFGEDGISFIPNDQRKSRNEHYFGCVVDKDVCKRFIPNMRFVLQYECDGPLMVTKSKIYQIHFRKSFENLIGFKVTKE